MRLILIVFAVLAVTTASAQEQGKWQGKFEQLDQMLPTPNEYRNSAGGPGSKYWQQRADYVIDAEIDEQTNILHGKETITYTNNSPESLSFLWLQLDQNVNKKGNEDFGYLFGGVRDSINTRTMQFLTRPIEFQAGHVIESVTDMAGKTLPTLINNTMMRIDLAAPLKPGSSVSFKVNWNYAITDRSMFLLSREGYEYFPEDDNRAYMIAHWYPRMCAFDDTEGWQNKQFRRLGEFTLEFGNYTVNITVPADHLVASTGVLQNPGEVLSDVQQARLAEARKSYDKPVFIVTE
ncbi:MAG: M1 family peptidase, partial [Cyclobacteriaceae bacterium]|nr:M1 family peptidase [Cyclobacteriaceae bacterium]